MFYSDQDWTSPVAETFAELLIWLPAAESADGTKRTENNRNVIVCVRLKIYRKWKQQEKKRWNIHLNKCYCPHYLFLILFSKQWWQGIVQVSYNL